MGKNIVVSPVRGPLPGEMGVEAVERKGRGHPDTLCDYITEGVSRALSRYYLSEFGCVMHHNVDKALLVGGAAEPGFGGGRVVKPIEFIVAGRAIKSREGRALPVDEIAEETVRRTLASNVRHIDPEKDFKVTVMIRPGSRDLVGLFERFGRGEVPLANDTSCGVGFYPLDRLENAVLEAERFLNSPEIKKMFPFIGEDVKVMGIRSGEDISLTAAVAVVDRYVSSVDDYAQKVGELKRAVLACEWARGVSLAVNTADDYERGSIYLTVTGTSAEQGDDGQVGRGNRVNGLITPYRPMTLEAAAGKNPVSHVGKLYNLYAADLCRSIVENGLAREASAFLVSRIGNPINEPQVLDIKVRPGDADFGSIRNMAALMLDEMPFMWKRVLAGEYEIA